MNLINKNALRDLMEEPPRGQRIYKAFEGEWDLLTDNQLKDIFDILDGNFEEYLKILRQKLVERGLGA